MTRLQYFLRIFLFLDPNSNDGIENSGVGCYSRTGDNSEIGKAYADCFTKLDAGGNMLKWDLISLIDLDVTESQWSTAATEFTIDSKIWTNVRRLTPSDPWRDYGIKGAPIVPSEWFVSDVGTNLYTTSSKADDFKFRQKPASESIDIVCQKRDRKLNVKYYFQRNIIILFHSIRFWVLPKWIQLADWIFRMCPRRHRYENLG